MSALVAWHFVESSIGRGVLLNSPSEAVAYSLWWKHLIRRTLFRFPSLSLIVLDLFYLDLPLSFFFSSRKSWIYFRILVTFIAASCSWRKGHWKTWECFMFYIRQSVTTVKSVLPPLLYKSEATPVRMRHWDPPFTG